MKIGLRSSVGRWANLIGFAKSCNHRSDGVERTCSNRYQQHQIDESSSYSATARIFGPDHLCVSFHLHLTNYRCHSCFQDSVSRPCCLSINDKIDGRKRKISFFDMNFSKCDMKVGVMKQKQNLDTWVLASHNKGKISELRDILAARGLDLKSAADINLVEPEETESTFEGNAALKSEAACVATQLICLADDSGLSVDALDGDPGIYSARWAGEPRDFDRAMARVHEALEARQASNRTARFVCVIAVSAPGEDTRVYRGEVEGEIVWPPRGEGGFGYDAIFQPLGHDRTFAQMSSQDKKSMSHRGRALEAMIAAEFDA